MPTRPTPTRLPLPDAIFLSRVLAVVALVLAGCAVIALVLPPQAGVLGLALVFEFQILVAALLVLVPAALILRSRMLRAAVLVVAVVVVVRFSSEWVSLPASQAPDLTVMSWNLEHGARTGDQAVATLRTVSADVIGLQELEPRVAQAIEADPELAARYPYRYLVPESTVLGLGVLSRYPIERRESFTRPVFLRMVVKTPRADVILIDAHPLPGLIGFATSAIPVTFDPRARNDDLRRIRSKIDESLARGERLVVVGDFNTSSTEPAYATFVAGLRDAHVEAGEGPGWTWRSDRLGFLPFGLLRIDLQLAGGAVVPVSSSVDCSAKGDHCRLSAGYAFG